ncbi:TlpA family protein disulfide reductase [Quadrisphaera sp. KR29]|uniref:TlpA family protein disulfide reductase n=1 Tax=Quadrisphaera sp. KR29 TaxID=3461391 RepID=UPI004043EBE4
MSGLSRRALLAGALALPTAAALAGCSGLGQPGADTGNQQGYVSGDGTRQILPVADRGEPVALTGRTAEGETVDVADWRGQVVVINVWYAACAPCRAEAPELAAVAGDTPDVRFLGLNTRDDAAVALTFEKSFGIPYPSVLDAGSGQGLLALRGRIPPQAVPSTLVLDAQGRPAARVVGKVEEDVLRGIIDDVRSGRADDGDGRGSGSGA